MHNLNRISQNDPSLLTPYNSRSSHDKVSTCASSQSFKITSKVLRLHVEIRQLTWSNRNWWKKVLLSLLLWRLLLLVCFFISCSLNYHYALTVRILFHWNILDEWTSAKQINLWISSSFDSSEIPICAVFVSSSN